MYPYHNRIIQRIKNGELVSIKAVSGKYAVVFVFNSPPVFRPVKPQALWRYKNILDKYNDLIT